MQYEYIANQNFYPSSNSNASLHNSGSVELVIR